MCCWPIALGPGTEPVVWLIAALPVVFAGLWRGWSMRFVVCRLFPRQNVFYGQKLRFSVPQYGQSGKTVVVCQALPDEPGRYRSTLLKSLPRSQSHAPGHSQITSMTAFTAGLPH
ncbi:hypothetical protein ABBQ38_014474 [Trebouxia sp. C0009 RCD-2024]